MLYVTNDEIPEDNCSICQKTLKDPLKAVFKLDCGHFFHNNCLDDYCTFEIENNPYTTETNCPLCRTKFDPINCNTFWAFRNNALETKNLPSEVLYIYNQQSNTGGKRKQKRNNKSTKKNKSKKQNKYNKKIKKTKKQKIRYIK